jgi:hypothetical protein
VSVDRGKPEQVWDKLERFVTRYKTDYPIVLDPELKLVESFGGFSEVPTTFLVNAGGRLCGPTKDRRTLTG